MLKLEKGAAISLETGMLAHFITSPIHAQMT